MKRAPKELWINLNAETQRCGQSPRRRRRPLERNGAVSYFNSDQQSYMDSLARMPPENKCWCGWFPVGQCHTCPADKTLAQRQAVQCQSCCNAPDNFGAGKIIHNIRCTAGAKP